MIAELSPIEWISIAGFSVGLGALVARFLAREPSARAHLTSAGLIFVVAAIAVTTAQSVVRSRETVRLAARIERALGNQEKTTEQLRVELNLPDARLFASAVARLERENRIDSRLVNAELPTAQVVPIRLWRVDVTESQ